MSLSSVISDIKKIKIQGATNIAKQGLLALSEEVNNYRGINISQLRSFCQQLNDSRPTEPLLQNGINFVLNNIEQNKQILALSVSQSVANYLTWLQDAEDQIVKHGQILLKKDQSIFTHCHSSLVMKLIKSIAANKAINVVNTETEPLLQGRITARELAEAGIPVTHMIDSLAPYYLYNQRQKKKINKVLIGADAVSWSGDVYNKVGSFSIALAAQQAKIPVYVAVTALKTDADNIITIEERAVSEVWSDAPANTQVLNWAFDCVPAKYITGLITEFGVIKPTQLRSLVQKKYPWLIIKKK